MTQILLPEEQAAALRARAAEQGLTLENWLGQLAGVTASPKAEHRYRLADLISKCDSSAPLSQEDRNWLRSPNTGREVL